MIKELEKLGLVLAVREFKDRKGDKGHSISVNSRMYLDVLSYYDKINISDLATRLGVSKPAITLKMNELIEQGYVVKHQDKNDKRFHYVSLAPREVDELNNMFIVYDKLINDVENSIDKADVDAFKMVIAALTSAVGNYNESN